MNQDTYRRLKGWSHNKPRPIAVLGPLAAFSAEPLHWLVAQPGGKDILEQCGQRDVSWDDFYQSPPTLLRKMPAEFLDIDVDTRDSLADIAEYGTLPARDAMLLPFLKPEYQRQTIEERIGLTEQMVDDTLRMLATNERSAGDATRKFERYVENPGFRFVMRLVMPCFVQHRETPQDMSSRATSSKKHDLDAAKDLTRLDAGYPTTTPMKRIIDEASLEEAAQIMQYVMPTSGKPRQDLILSQVKHRMAGFVSFLGEFFDSALEAVE